MKMRLCTLLATLATLLVSCSNPEMEAIAARVQKTRIDNALHAAKARIRVWRDTSTHDKHGWHIHSEQEFKFTLPENEFKTARYLIVTHGFTAWHEQDKAPASLDAGAPEYIVELEWLDRHGVPTSSVDIPAICRESQLHQLSTSAFPFVLPDDAYNRFFALPSVGKALDIIRDEQSEH